MTAGKTNIRWLVLALIILATGVSYVLRTNVSAISESMMTGLGLTEFQLGMIFSAFAADLILDFIFIDYESAICSFFAVIASNSIGDKELPAATLSATPFRKSRRDIFNFLVMGSIS